MTLGSALLIGLVRALIVALLHLIVHALLTATEEKVSPIYAVRQESVFRVDNRPYRINRDTAVYLDCHLMPDGMDSVPKDATVEDMDVDSALGVVVKIWFHTKGK